MKATNLAAYGEKLINRIKEELEQKQIHLLYLNKAKKDVPEAYLKEVALTKRMLERWCADDKFRDALDEAPNKACKDWGIDIDPESLDIRSLWDTNIALDLDPDPSIHVLRYKAFIYEKLTHRNEIRASHPESIEEYNRWRNRQMKRCENELSHFMSKSIVHAPFCLELSLGCSVGCWFCGISAPKLEDLFLYTEQNKELYNGVLTVMREVYGPAAGKGFCYWATDPLDNPDYEKFLIDFEKVTGVFPQTTTALALKDLDRTRKLLELSRQYAGNIDRFSLLSLRQMDKLFDHFTPEELIHVELVTQNRENYLHKSRAGRAIEKEKKRTKPPKNGDNLSDGTIACISGFLINMVDREVKLISPCRATEKWPLGYIEFETGHFNTTEEFRKLVFGMIERHMNNLVHDQHPIKLYDYIKVDYKDDQILLYGTEIHRFYQNTKPFRCVVECLQQGYTTSQEICDKLWDEGIQIYEIIHALHVLLEDGYVDLEPEVVVTEPANQPQL